MNKEYLEPIHPGEVLLEDFMKPLAITQYALAKAINVPARRINESSTATEPSPQIQRLGWANISACIRNRG